MLPRPLRGPCRSAGLREPRRPAGQLAARDRGEPEPRRAGVPGHVQEAAGWRTAARIEISDALVGIVSTNHLVGIDRSADRVECGTSRSLGSTVTWICLVDDDGQPLSGRFVPIDTPAVLQSLIAHGWTVHGLRGEDRR